MNIVIFIDFHFFEYLYTNYGTEFSNITREAPLPQMFERAGLSHSTPSNGKNTIVLGSAKEV